MRKVIVAPAVLPTFLARRTDGRLPGRDPHLAPAVTALLLGLAAVTPLAARAAKVVDSDIRLLAPDDRARVTDPRPAIRIFLGPSIGEALLLLDGVDLTALAVRSPAELHCRPPAPLTRGEHLVKLIVAAPEGRVESTWSFTVGERKAAGGAAPLAGSARGALSGSGGWATSSRGAAPPSAMASASLQLDARSGAYQASAASSASWVSSGRGPAVIPGGFLATVKRGQSGLLVGDVSVVGTPQLASSLARRGLVVDLVGESSRVQAFQLAANPVRGFDPGVAFGSLDDQLMGVSASTTFLADRSLRVAAMVLAGRSDRDGGFNTASIADGSEGRAAGLQVSGTLLGASISAEGSVSQLDRGGGLRGDSALALRIARPIGPVALSAAYSRLGPEFGSMASPSAASDRQQLGVSAATGLGPATLSASFGRSNDNLGADPSRPVVRSTTGAAALGVAVARWPTLSLSFTRGVQGATDLPAGSPGVDSTSDTGTAALAWSRGAVAASLGGSLTRLDDRRPEGGSSTSAAVQASASLRPFPGFSCVPSLAHAESRAGGVTRQSELASLGLRLGPLGPVTLDGHGSFGRQRASDASADAEQAGGALRLAWPVGPFFGPPGRGLQGAISANARYDRLRDRGPTPRTVEAWSTFVALDLSLPFDLRTGP